MLDCAGRAALSPLWGPRGAHRDAAGQGLTANIADASTPQLQNAAIFVVFLMIVLLRPQGLFGRSAERA